MPHQESTFPPASQDIASAIQAILGSDGVRNELESTVDAPERRSEARLPLGLEGWLIGEHATGGPISVSVVDLSESGAGLLVNADIPRGPCTLIVRVASGREFRFRGEVRYCRRVNTAPLRYRAGMQFLSVLPSAVNG